MALHRFFAEEHTAGPGDGTNVLPLAPSDIHHLRDVLRLVPGDEIVVVDGGAATVVRLTEIGERVSGEPVGQVAAPRLPRVTLVQALAKGEKMDDVVRQSTELGVARIVPFAAERSVVRLDAAKAAARVQRWRRIAAEAAKQSQRLELPLVDEIVEAAGLPERLKGSVVLVCWEDATGAPGIGSALREAALSDDTDVAVVVGPEGGLTADEVSALEEGGAIAVSLGDTVLRTETAGVVATALAIYERGGLGARDD